MRVAREEAERASDALVKLLPKRQRLAIYHWLDQMRAIGFGPCGDGATPAYLTALDLYKKEQEHEKENIYRTTIRNAEAQRRRKEHSALLHAGLPHKQRVSHSPVPRREGIYQ